MTMLRRLWVSGDPAARECSVPGCQRVAVLGDGPDTPCWPHVLQFGHAAADPEHLSDGEVVILLEAHGDVVELVTHTKTVGKREYERTQRWRWLVP